MVSSGTIKTLAALLAAMTVGTGALYWMSTVPARPVLSLPLQATGPGDDDNCLALVRDTDVPLQYVKWRNVVVHDGGRQARGCHFVIDAGGRISTTSRWRVQQNGQHITMPGFSYNTNSIGICLMTDPTASGPTPQQLAALISLVRPLQDTCQISPDYVYLPNELGGAGCYWPKSQENRFRQSLLPVSR